VQPFLTSLTGSIHAGTGSRLGIMRTMPTQPNLFEAGPPPGGDGASPGDASRSRAPGLPPPHVVALQSGRPWWAKLAGWVLRPWIALRIEPPTPPDLVDARPVCYVLEDYGLSNALILDRACRETGMPGPLRPLPGDPLGRRRAYVALSRRNAGSTLALATGQAAPRKTPSESLARLLDAHREDPALDVQLVPVSIFVGRSPDKASGWFSVLFSENWAIVGRFRRLLAILLNGRDTLVRFAAPVSIRSLLAEDLPP